MSGIKTMEQKVLAWEDDTIKVKGQKMSECKEWKKTQESTVT